MTRGVDEGDRPVHALVLTMDLVGADVLGDAAGLAGLHVGVADRVEQSGLSVVDVAHDRDDRGTGLEVVLVLGVDAELEVDVEGVEELLLLLLGRDHADVVAELGPEHLEGVLVQALRGRRHLTEVEQDRDQRCRVGVDLVGEVGQGRTLTNLDDRGAVTARDLHTTDRRGLHLLELLALRALGLPPPLGTAATATEGTLGATTTTGATTGTTAEATATTGTATEATAGTRPGARAGTTRGTTARRSLARTRNGGATGHHARARTRPAGTRSGGTGSPGARTGSTTTGRRPRHTLAGGEGVVARARGSPALTGRSTHALAGGKGVVAGPRLARTRTGTGRGRGTGSTVVPVTGLRADRGGRCRSGRSRSDRRRVGLGRGGRNRCSGRRRGCRGGS